MTEPKKITAFVGQPVQITLQSMAGSTGYSWYLTTLDGGLALSCTTTAPTGPGIAPVNQTFDLLAIKDGTYKVVFELMAPWRPGESGDTAVYEIEISQTLKSAADEISKAMDGRAFTNAQAVNVGDAANASAVLKYAVPMSYGNAGTAPPQVIYAAPMVQAASLNAMTPQVVYAAPMAQSSPVAAMTTPQVVYAAPMAQSSPVAAMTCPQVVYAAPMAQASTMAAQPGQLGFADPATMAAQANMIAAQNLAAAPITVLYAAPMTQAAGLNTAPITVLYAAPITQAAGLNTAPITVLYAAPITAGAQPLYAAPMVIRYAVPSAMGGATMIQPYAAPFTSNGCC
jgi:hypothetical protein